MTGGSFTTLVSAAELRSRVGEAGCCVFDCRHDLTRPDAGAAAYAAAHIPGAQFMHLDRDLSAPLTGRNGRHPLPDPDAFAAVLAARGVSNETQVVVYDDAGGTFAGRLWWMLRWLGHARVAVLDGGVQAWVAVGGDLTQAVPRPTPAVFVPLVGEGLVDASAVSASLGDGTTVLLDARAPERYRGDAEPLDPVAGHIPGAVSHFFRNNLAADSCFKRPAELRASFEALLGGRAPRQLVHYCGSGVTACHNLLAMEIAGLHGSRLYAGSWSEWCADPARPAECG